MILAINRIITGIFYEVCLKICVCVCVCTDNVAVSYTLKFFNIFLTIKSSTPHLLKVQLPPLATKII